MKFEDCCQAFAASYEVSNLPAMRGVERTTLGCDYGGTSWTTRTQAAQIVEMLRLRPGFKLLDVGAGSGWPGLFLADTSGCDVTLLDLPLNALAKAIERAGSDGIDDRVSATVASGSAIPFRNASFDAISHSDVLCCMPEKAEMLRECRRVATDRAKMLFSVIAVPRHLSEGHLSEADHDRAVEAGPPFVDASNSYADLLASNSYADLLAQSGWRLVERIDATPEHVRSLSALVKAFENSAELADALGKDVVSEAGKLSSMPDCWFAKYLLPLPTANEASQISSVNV